MMTTNVAMAGELSEVEVAIDLFAGVGGLSTGLTQTGFRIAAAVEIDPVAAATFKHNHPDVEIIQDDIRNITPSDIDAATLGRKIDLVVGCAPCQGFCSLTHKHKREDPRNALVLDMVRLIEACEPDVVVMENVPGLMTRGSELLEEFVGRLRGAGYYVNQRIIQMADYGVPQNRRRFVLLAGRGFVIPFPKPTHAKSPEAGSGLEKWVTVRKVIYGRRAPVTLERAQRNGGPAAFNWHVVRNLQPQTKCRLRAAKPGATWLALDEGLRPDCHRGGYVGFTNVYGRMEWDRISPTITAGCTTPAKGRFGHPDRRRTTISVREAALLQTIPETYVFPTDGMEAVCDMIGNAVPPLFASVIARQVKRSLRAHRLALAGS